MGTRHGNGWKNVGCHPGHYLFQCNASMCTRSLERNLKCIVWNWSWIVISRVGGRIWPRTSRHQDLVANYVSQQSYIMFMESKPFLRKKFYFWIVPFLFPRNYHDVSCFGNMRNMQIEIGPDARIVCRCNYNVQGDNKWEANDGLPCIMELIHCNTLITSIL